MFYLVEPGAYSQPVFDCLRLRFTKRTQCVCGGVEKIDVGFQQRSMTGSKARTEDRAHTIANGFEVRHTPPLSANRLVVDRLMFYE